RGSSTSRTRHLAKLRTILREVHYSLLRGMRRTVSSVLRRHYTPKDVALTDLTSRFSRSMRGYRVDEVDQYVAKVESELADLRAHVEDLRRAHTALGATNEEQVRLIAELQEQVEELGATGYSGLGLRVEKSLQIAED